MMEAARTSGTTVELYQTTRPCNPNCADRSETFGTMVPALERRQESPLND
jgi:hypothetical protein